VCETRDALAAILPNTARKSNMWIIDTLLDFAAFTAIAAFLIVLWLWAPIIIDIIGAMQ
jgi:hypothetical protein